MNEAQTERRRGTQRWEQVIGYFGENVSDETVLLIDVPRGVFCSVVL